MALSTDARVSANGLAVGVTGAAAGTPYTLRRTLGLQTLSGTTVTRTYQRGDANGSVVVDGGVLATTAATSYATAGYLAISASNDGSVTVEVVGTVPVTDVTGTVPVARPARSRMACIGERVKCASFETVEITHCEFRATSSCRAVRPPSGRKAHG